MYTLWFGRIALLASVIVALLTAAFAADPFIVPKRFIADASNVAVADMNGDGIRDLVVTGKSDLSMLLGTGRGSFGTAIVTNSGTGGPITIADLNHDGKQDVVLVSATTGQVFVFLGN